MNIIFCLILITAAVSAAASPPPPSPPGCTDELIAFSPCLGYASEPPNNLTNTATEKCCDPFLKALESGDGSSCLCYLIKQPLMFGFPLNESRVLSLPSVCYSLNSSFPLYLPSLDSICSGRTSELPPLSSSGSVNSNPSPSGSIDVNSPLPTFPPESGNTPPVSRGMPPDFALPGLPLSDFVEPTLPPPDSVVSTQPASMTPPVKRSSSSKNVNDRNNWFLPAAIILLLTLAHM